jgi:hypothetical protein
MTTAVKCCPAEGLVFPISYFEALAGSPQETSSSPAPPGKLAHSTGTCSLRTPPAQPGCHSSPDVPRHAGRRDEANLLGPLDRRPMPSGFVSL